MNEIAQFKVLTIENAEENFKYLASMHHLRFRIFRRRLAWPVDNFSFMEHDQFDTADAVHIDKNDTVNACTRLLPTTKPNLLADVFPHLVTGGEPPKADDIWETTRFCADPDTAPSNITGLLVAAMLEYGIGLGLRHYVSVSDIRIEPLLRRAGWEPKRLGEPHATGTDMAAAEIFEVSDAALARVRMRSKITKPLLTDSHYAPAARLAA